MSKNTKSGDGSFYKLSIKQSNQLIAENVKTELENLSLRLISRFDNACTDVYTALDKYVENPENQSYIDIITDNRNKLENIKKEYNNGKIKIKKKYNVEVDNEKFTNKSYAFESKIDDVIDAIDTFLGSAKLDDDIETVKENILGTANDDKKYRGGKRRTKRRRQRSDKKRTKKRKRKRKTRMKKRKTFKRKTNKMRRKR